MTLPAEERRLVVDPIACDGIGICSHLAATIITLDSWGYPIIEAGPLSPADSRVAHAAAAACPRKALFLT